MRVYVVLKSIDIWRLCEQTERYRVRGSFLEADRDMKKDKETWRNIGQIGDEYAEDIL